jgi:hypothetical protein
MTDTIINEGEDTDDNPKSESQNVNVYMRMRPSLLYE